MWNLSSALEICSAQVTWALHLTSASEKTWALVISVKRDTEQCLKPNLSQTFCLVRYSRQTYNFFYSKIPSLSANFQGNTAVVESICS